MLLMHFCFVISLLTCNLAEHVSHACALSQCLTFVYATDKQSRNENWSLILHCASHFICILTWLYEPVIISTQLLQVRHWKVGKQTRCTISIMIPNYAPESVLLRHFRVVPMGSIITINHWQKNLRKSTNFFLKSGEAPPTSQPPRRPSSCFFTIICALRSRKDWNPRPPSRK